MQPVARIPSLPFAIKSQKFLPFICLVIYLVIHSFLCSGLEMEPKARCMLNNGSILEI